MQEKITGYRTLSSKEIGLINESKILAVQVGAFIDSLDGSDCHDKRWLAVAKTQLQQGFMALNRAIAKPETF